MGTQSVPSSRIAEANVLARTSRPCSSEVRSNGSQLTTRRSAAKPRSLSTPASWCASRPCCARLTSPRRCGGKLSIAQESLLDTSHQQCDAVRTAQQEQAGPGWCPRMGSVGMGPQQRRDQIRHAGGCEPIRWATTGMASMHTASIGRRGTAPRWSET
jgi:hypothetical protein